MTLKTVPVEQRNREMFFSLAGQCLADAPPPRPRIGPWLIQLARRHLAAEVQ